jgi:hypothetical protein
LLDKYPIYTIKWLDYIDFNTVALFIFELNKYVYLQNKKSYKYNVLLCLKGIYVENCINMI